MQPTIKFNNGQVAPAFGLGTWLSAPGEVGAAVKIALNAGYKHIDCAACYGNEPEIGVSFSEYFSSPGAAKREEIFVTSKLWVKDFTTVKEACQKTLKDLQLQYLDLYLIHLPFEVEQSIPGPVPEEGVGLIGYNVDRINEVWKHMEELVDAGLVKSIGVSNFSIEKIEKLLASSPKIVPVTNQVELHPYLPQTRLFDYCNKKGITLTAYSPLGAPGRPDVMKAKQEPLLLANETIVAIAKKNNVTVGQVLFAWGLQRGTIVIPKSTNEKRINENLACLSVKLNKDDMTKIDGIEKRYRYIKQRWAIFPGDPLESLWDGEYLE